MDNIVAILEVLPAQHRLFALCLLVVFLLFVLLLVEEISLENRKIKIKIRKRRRKKRLTHLGRDKRGKG